MRAYSTIEDNSISHLRDVFLALIVIVATITSISLKVCVTRHANAGWPSIPLVLAFSPTSTGLDSSKSLRGIHKNYPSFKST